jgi:hypothetical protein
MEGEGAWDFFTGLLAGRDFTGWLLAEGGDPKSAAAGPVMAVPLPVPEPVPAEPAVPEPQPDRKPPAPEDGKAGEEGTLESLEPEIKALADLSPGLLSLGVFVVSEDKVVGRLFVECHDGKGRDALADALQALKVKFKEKAAQGGMTLSGRVKKEKKGVSAKLQLSGIGQAISRFWMEALKKKGGKRR